jgi:hypothetical protein
LKYFTVDFVYCEDEERDLVAFTAMSVPYTGWMMFCSVIIIYMKFSGRLGEVAAQTHTEYCEVGLGGVKQWAYK